MPTAFEQLKARQATQPQGQAPKASSFDALKSRAGTVPAAPQQAAPAQDSGVKGGILGEIFTGNTQRFGKTIGESLAAPGNADKFDQTLQGWNEVRGNLVKKIAEKKQSGQDAARFEQLLRDHNADMPKLEDFTGDVINKTAGQVAGEAGGTLLEVLPFGTYGKAAKGMQAGELAAKAATKPSAVEATIKAFTKPKSLLTKAAAKAAGEGAAFGYGVDVTQGLQNKEGAESFKPGLGTLLGAVAPVAAKGAGVALEKAAASRAAKATEDVGRLVKAVTQGDDDAVKAYSSAARQVDLTHAKTFQEATDMLNQGIRDIKQASNAALDTNPYDKPVSELSLKTKVGGQELSHNYVEDSLSQLRRHYESVNDQKGLAEIDQLIQKGAKSGLSVREIDELAVRHGRDLSGFNANGELSSGLSKQAAENTRKGLKATARAEFGNKVYNEADSAITDLIRTRDLFEEMAVKVQKAQNRVKEMGLKDRVGSLLEKAVNLSTLGTSRSFMSAFARELGTPGARTANALDLQKVMQKNIKRIDDIFQKGDQPEKTLTKLRKYLMENGINMPGTDNGKKK